MCGVAGAVGAIDGGVLDAVARMSSAQAHRGPDQHGSWSSPEAALGHRRLSILDLSEAGRQPMRDARSGAVLVFNGEVYNFAELRRELAEHGDGLSSATDTEVVLRAYVRWGEASIERLRGMFALAIVDPRRPSTERVLLARDRLGIKPLYTYATPGRLWFASELRALLASGAPARRLDPRGLEAFLWHGFVPGPRTMIEGIRLLPPGTTAWVGADGTLAAPRRYWSPPRARPDAPGPSVERLAAELEEAVRLRLVADVPLGIFLSGGVDSSAVAALAQRVSARPVRTFTLRFEEARYDESPHAREVAARLGTRHEEVTLGERDFADRLDDALGSIDQPTFDAINTYFVSRAVREAGLTVALAGTGGDELFGGYASFRDVPPARRAAAALGPRLGRTLGRGVTAAMGGRRWEVRAQTRWGKLGDVLSTGGDLLSLYQTRYGLFTEELHRALAARPGDPLDPDGLDHGLDAARAAELRGWILGEPTLHALSTLELSSFVGERLLRDTDAASMAVSLEVRVPLLDHRVIEALARVPERARYGALGKKALLRGLVSRELDPSIFERPKAGFELPLAVWCRSRLEPRIGEALRDVASLERIGLDAETVGRLWRAFSRRAPGIYWSRVWAIFALTDWCRRNEVSA